MCIDRVSHSSSTNKQTIKSLPASAPSCTAIGLNVMKHVLGVGLLAAAHWHCLSLALICVEVEYMDGGLIVWWWL